MIDWSAFVAVAVASLVAATAIVTFYAIGLRLLTPVGHQPSLARKIAGYSCFLVCALGVLYGIYLIVPAFHA